MTATTEKEHCSTKDSEKENNAKRGTKKSTALRTYACLYFVVVVLVLVVCLDNEAPQSAEDFATDHAVSRRSALLSSAFQPLPSESSDADCAGKRVYMYELPSEFNTRFKDLCANQLVDWLNLCPHFHNGGLGKKVDAAGHGGEDWSDWYRTDPYMLEVIFHSRMRTYPCRTRDPSRANAFFLPWYGGLDALPWLYDKRAAVPTRGRFGAEIFAWLEKNGGEWWRRHGGKDHFIVLGRTAWDFALDDDDDLRRWGTGFFSLPSARNLTSLLLESRHSSRFENERAVPYPTSFHPSSPGTVARWIQRARSSRRDYLMTYAGAPRPQMDGSIRGVIAAQCADAAGTTCSLVDCAAIKCSHDPVPISRALLRSTFCLQPRGDTATRRSTFDCLIAGAIPVFFHEDSAYTQYKWHLPTDRASFSVHIPEEDVRRGLLVKNLLRSYSAEKIAAMRSAVLDLIPSLIYNNYASFAGSNETRDSFEISVQAVLERIAAYKNSHPSI